ncbi:diguanylate cyclase [Chitinimonas viridis]|uniref:Diguanylate cyclase n=1 Tax=Chitinimonas viridis TaxID=664880 RepID=A0ABT8B931_9NEIS|nr:diguanylate cyclase [Chitinimonas viridis]MDN3578646.1 diguanylate cyclase [Chitinimonas viridis]
MSQTRSLLRRPHRLVEIREFLQARRRLLSWLLAAACVMSSLIAWELVLSHQDTRKASQLAGHNLSLLLKEQLDGAFRETDLVLRDLAGRADTRQLARLPTITADEKLSLSILLDDKLSTLPQVEFLAFVSPDGSTALSPGYYGPADARQRGFYQQLQDNPGQELVFSPPMQIPNSIELGFLMARRIPSRDRQMGGMVVALVKLEYFHQLARRLEAVEGSVFTLTDNNLLVVARYPEISGAIGKAPANSLLLSSWVDGRSTGYTVTRSPYDAVERGYTFRRLEHFPFIVLVGQPENAYYGDWRLKAGAYVSTLLVLLCFGLAMIWRGWREAKLALALQLGAQRLQEQDAHIVRAIETISRPLLLVRADGDIILQANKAAAELCGLPVESLIGQPLTQLYLRPEHHVEITAQLTARQSLTDYELKFRRPNGDSYWVALSGSVIEYQGERAYFVNLTDISERKRAQESLWRRATLDPLTGVPNRGYFLERAQLEWLRAVRYGHQVGVLMLDLDHFKTVNDTHGHDAGDQVLQRFAERMQGELRETDLFGRLGGEEFAVLLPEEAETGLLEAAERLRNALASKPIVLEDGHALAITMSVGCTLSNELSPDIESLLKEADQALYAAKAAGRNRVMAYKPVVSDTLR